MLRLADVSAGYDETVVLRGVSLSVPPGAIVALIGPNGAGKTTLLRVASGLLRPTSGVFTIDGTNCSDRSPAGLAALGVCHVPEGRGVFPSLTVRDNLRLFGGRTDRLIDAATAAFPVLGSRLDQRAGTLSGGEQQMLALSRTYAGDPRYVLLDEVSMGLAPRIVDEIFEFLVTLADRGVSLLLVEQYVSRALALAEYVYLLNRGTISFRGEPSELETGDDLFSRYLGAT